MTIFTLYKTYTHRFIVFIPTLIYKLKLMNNLMLHLYNIQRWLILTKLQAKTKQKIIQISHIFQIIHAEY